jgi:cell filamentation protein
VTPALESEFRSLQSWDVKSADAEEFVERSAHHLGELNAIHPFREGNGRTMRIHLHRLAIAAGQELDITQLSSKEWNQASIEAHQGDVSRMKDVIAIAIGREQTIITTTANKGTLSMVEQTVEATSSLSSQSLEAHKEQFVARVNAVMDRNEELSQLGAAERLSLAATVAIEEARETGDSLAARQQIYTGLSLVADAQDNVHSIIEEEKVASDIERFRDTMIEVAQTSSNDDVRAMANRYLPSLDKMVDEAKEQVKEQEEDNEVEL